MALGYCRVCDKLLSIRPGGQKWGSREVNWYPTSHWVNVHKGCDGLVVFTGLDENEYPTSTACMKCGPVGLLDFESKRCPGEKKSL